MKVISSSELTGVSIERLLKRYGVGRRRDKMEPIYKTVLADAERLAAPTALYNQFRITELPDLSQWLSSKTNSIILALCTLGPRLQEHFNELVQKDILAATVLDEITLAWVTAITRQIHGAIRDELQGSSLKAGPPFRPGVGRWPLETQQIVFAFLPSATIGVALDEHLVMTPRQSTSLIIPLINRN